MACFYGYRIARLTVYPLLLETRSTNQDWKCGLPSKKKLSSHSLVERAVLPKLKDPTHITLRSHCIHNSVDLDILNEVTLTKLEFL